jgi:hypothetical protein
MPVKYPSQTFRPSPKLEKALPSANEYLIPVPRVWVMMQLPVVDDVGYIHASNVNGVVEVEGVNAEFAGVCKYASVPLK